MITLFTIANTFAEVSATLDFETRNIVTRNIINWFAINGLAADQTKFQVMFLGLKHNISYIQYRKYFN